MGVITVMCGSNFVHNVQNMLYEATRMLALSHAAAYSNHTFYGEKESFLNPDTIFNYLPSLWYRMATTASRPSYIREAVG